MSQPFSISRVDSVAAFNSNSTAPRGVDILASCMLHDFKPSSAANNTATAAAAISASSYSHDDGISVTLFNTGTLAIKRITRDRVVSFTAADLKAQQAAEKNNSNSNTAATNATAPAFNATSTLSWDQLQRETQSGSRFIVGTTFNSGTCVVRRVIASHVDIAAVYPPSQPTTIAAQIRQQFHPNRPAQRSGDDDEDDDDDHHEGENQQQQFSPRGNDSVSSAAAAANTSGVRAQLPGSTAPPAPPPQRQQAAQFSIQPSTALNATSDASRLNSNNSGKTASSCRYVIVGAALCEFNDGRCALFTVSTHLTQLDLLRGTAYHSAVRASQQQQKTAAATGEQAPPPPQQQQQPNYPLEAETSILELPPGCVNVEVQVATASVLVRIAERKNSSVVAASGALYNQQHQQQQQRISSSTHNVVSSSVLCLALDSSGRPIGAASMRGRALSPFTPGMAGVRALWRIAEDGTCSGNLNAGPGGILDAWLLGGGGGGGGKHQQQQKAHGKQANSNDLIVSQHHQIIACTWLEPLVVMRGHRTAFVGGANHNVSGVINQQQQQQRQAANPNSNPSFSCISVIQSEWREIVPSSTAGIVSPFIAAHQQQQSQNGSGGDENAAGGGGSVVIDHAVCSVLLSQMVADDPADTLHGFQHRKLATFQRPAIFNTLCNGSTDTAGKATMNGDGTLLLVTAPTAVSRVPTAGYAVAVVVLALPVSSSASASGDDENDSVAGFEYLFATHAGGIEDSAADLQSRTMLIAATNPSRTFSPAQRQNSSHNNNKNCCVVTFQLQCSHAASHAHSSTPAQVVFSSSSGGRNSNKAAFFFFPHCGCGAFVADVLRAAPLIQAEPILGHGCVNPFGSLGLRNTEKFPIVPRLARVVLAPPPPHLMLSAEHVANSMVQASFFSSAATATAAAAGQQQQQQLATSAVPFMFAGLQSSNDSKSGSALSVIYAVVSSNSNAVVPTATTMNNNGATTAAITTSRLVESVGAEAVFLTQQFRSLDASFFAAASTTNPMLKQSGLAMLESFFCRCAYVATITNNVYTRRKDDFHLFAVSVLQLAKFAEVVLAGFSGCFADRVERADTSVLHAQNRAKMDQAVSHFVATAFAGAVSKLLHLGLISIASRVAHTVGDHCPFIADLVYPAAAALYKNSGVNPSYASYLHDVQPLLSDDAVAMLARLEKVRTQQNK